MTSLIGGVLANELNQSSTEMRMPCRRRVRSGDTEGRLRALQAEQEPRRTLPTGVVYADDEDDDDEMEPWEKYRNDLRYDANGDGVVDELDFPDWRSAGQ